MQKTIKFVFSHILTLAISSLSLLEAGQILTPSADPDSQASRAYFLSTVTKPAAAGQKDADILSGMDSQNDVKFQGFVSAAIKKINEKFNISIDFSGSSMNPREQYLQMAKLYYAGDSFLEPKMKPLIKLTNEKKFVMFSANEPTRFGPYTFNYDLRLGESRADQLPLSAMQPSLVIGEDGSETLRLTADNKYWDFTPKPGTAWQSLKAQIKAGTFSSTAGGVSLDPATQTLKFTTEPIAYAPSGNIFIARGTLSGMTLESQMTASHFKKADLQSSPMIGTAGAESVEQVVQVLAGVAGKVNAPKKDTPADKAKDIFGHILGGGHSQTPFICPKPETDA